MHIPATSSLRRRKNREEASTGQVAVRTVSSTYFDHSRYRPCSSALSVEETHSILQRLRFIMHSRSLANHAVIRDLTLQASRDTACSGIVSPFDHHPPYSNSRPAVTRQLDRSQSVKPAAEHRFSFGDRHPTFEQSRDTQPFTLRTIDADRHLRTPAVCQPSLSYEGLAAMTGLLSRHNRSAPVFASEPQPGGSIRPNHHHPGMSICYCYYL